MLARHTLINPNYKEDGSHDGLSAFAMSAVFGDSGPFNPTTIVL